MIFIDSCGYSTRRTSINSNQCQIAQIDIDEINTRRSEEKEETNQQVKQTIAQIEQMKQEQ